MWDTEGEWPPCAQCQAAVAPSIIMSGPPPLLFPPPFASFISKRQRKMYKERLRMAHNLRPILISLHGLQVGRTHSPSSLSALHWKCAPPIIHSAWRRLSASPLLPEVAKVPLLLSKPLPYGSTTRPPLLSQDFNPYHKQPHLLVPRSQVVADLVSLPSQSLVAKPFPLLLPPDLAALYTSPTAFLSTDALHWQKARAMRAQLLMPFSQYAKLLLRLFQLRMIRFFPSSQVRVKNGLMCVWKGESSQWLIFDGRAANFVFLPLPHVDLPHPTDLQQLLLRPHQNLLLAKMNMDSYYYRLSVPELWIPLLGLPTLSLSKVSVSLKNKLLACLDGCPVSDILSPVALTLPMGLSHSVFIAQEIHLYLLLTARLAIPHPLPNPTIQAHTEVLSCIYINDNFLAWRVDPTNRQATCDQAKRLLGVLADLYCSHGLLLNPAKSEGPTFQLNFLGITIDGKNGLLLPQLHTLKALLFATRWVLSLPKLSSKLLQRLVGHWVWLLLLRRPVLSLLFATYRFLAAYPSPSSQQPVWASVRLELSALMALAPLLFASLDRPASTYTLASDASLSDAGSVISPNLVVPTPSISSLQWRPLFSFPWKFNESILILEAKALLYAVRRLAFFNKGMGKRLLIFSDNQPLVFMASKGRSSTFLLSKVLRSLAAAILSSSATLEISWVSTELNPADVLSRVCVCKTSAILGPGD